MQTVWVETVWGRQCEIAVQCCESPQLSVSGCRAAAVGLCPFPAGELRLCCCHRTAVPHRKVGSQGSTRCRLLCSCSRRAREGAGSAQSPREPRGRREHWGMWQSCAVGNPAVQPQAGAASSRAVPHAQLRSDVRTPRPCGAEECGQWKILALFVSPHQPSAHRTTPFRAVYAFQDPFMHIWQTSDTDTVQPDG